MLQWEILFILLGGIIFNCNVMQYWGSVVSIPTTSFITWPLCVGRV